MFKRAKNEGVIDLFFSQDFENIMQFMSHTSLSPNLVSFFAKFIPSDIQTLPEILCCLVEIIYVSIEELRGKSRNSGKFFTPK